MPGVTLPAQMQLALRSGSDERRTIRAQLLLTDEWLDQIAKDADKDDAGAAVTHVLSPAIWR